MTDNPTLPLVEEMARAIADVIWPLADWDGERAVAETAAGKAAQAAAAIAQRRVSELEKQRLMILAAVYAEAPKFVATICDTSLDRSGALLGEVRDLARAALAKDETA